MADDTNVFDGGTADAGSGGSGGQSAGPWANPDQVAFPDQTQPGYTQGYPTSEAPQPGPWADPTTVKFPDQTTEGYTQGPSAPDTSGVPPVNSQWLPLVSQGLKSGADVAGKILDKQQQPGTQNPFAGGSSSASAHAVPLPPRQPASSGAGLGVAVGVGVGVFTLAAVGITLLSRKRARRAS